ncbi:MAG: DUF4349 domain-containing protein, partial [Chloroflexota bacterium]
MKRNDKLYKSQSTFIYLMLMVALLLGGCGASYDTASYNEAVAPAAYAPAEEEADLELLYDSAASGDGGLPITDGTALEEPLSSSEAQPQSSKRVIIYTGDIALVVKDTHEAVQGITQLAEAKGGFVANSNIYEYGDVPRGSITIRVPADMYQTTLADLRSLALRVERESSDTQDVTEEFTDLQARKTNLEFTETALQELLETRENSGETADILEVHRELTNIRGQIEQIEGRLRFLANQSALSTITVELTPDILYQPVSVAG